jgi:hypothetical protein
LLARKGFLPIDRANVSASFASARSACAQGWRFRLERGLTPPNIALSAVITRAGRPAPGMPDKREETERRARVLRSARKRATPQVRCQSRSRERQRKIHDAIADTHQILDLHFGLSSSPLSPSKPNGFLSGNAVTLDQ